MLKLLMLMQLQVSVPVVKNFLPSEGKRDTTKNFVVIHSDGGNLSAKLTRRVLRIRGLAYHYFIDRKGVIHQFMPLHLKAEHAGNSEWGDLKKWNDFSIGVCLQGNNFLKYTNEQYESLKKLLHYINVRYPDSKTRPVLTHAEIAYPRNRKSDPGEHFDLRRLYNDTTDIPRR